MRRTYSTITPQTVHAHARIVLRDTLGFGDYKRSVTHAQLIDLLLLVAATARTLFAIATVYFRFSNETARQAIHHNLTSLDELADRLADALHAVATFTRRDRRRL